MKYVIHGETRSIEFKTALIVSEYEGGGRCCVSINTDAETLMSHWFESGFLNVMMFDRKKVYIAIENDETLGEFKEKLIKLGIEVLKDEICSSEQRQTV